MNQPAHNTNVHRLALRVREIAQLFNSMDPTPFLNKDLDPAANSFIETWASVYSSRSNFHITIHLKLWPEYSDPNGKINEAIHNHFNYNAVQTRKLLKQLLLQGRISFAIGIVFDKIDAYV
jgi:hypothetical protein